MNYEQALAIDSESAIERLTTRLMELGCRVERSFDLRSALTSRSLAACQCQFIVLLVYDQLDCMSPAVITAHECEGFTRLKFETPSNEWWLRLMAACEAVVIQSAAAGLPAI